MVDICSGLSATDMANLESGVDFESFPPSGMYASYLGRENSKENQISVDLTIVELRYCKPDKIDPIYTFYMPPVQEGGSFMLRKYIPMVKGYKYMTIAFLGNPGRNYRSIIEAGGVQWTCGDRNLFLVADAGLEFIAEDYSSVYLSVKYTHDMPKPVHDIYSNGNFIGNKPVWYIPMWSLSPVDAQRTVGADVDERVTYFIAQRGKIRLAKANCGPKVKIERIDPAAMMDEFAWTMGCIQVRPTTQVVVWASGKKSTDYAITIVCPTYSHAVSELPVKFKLTSGGDVSQDGVDYSGVAEVMRVA